MDMAMIIDVKPLRTNAAPLIYCNFENRSNEITREALLSQYRHSHCHQHSASEWLSTECLSGLFHSFLADPYSSITYAESYVSSIPSFRLDFPIESQTTIKWS
jgi:hypothetical protein